MLRMRDYTPAMRDWLAACAERAGHPLRRGLRSGFATDALIALQGRLPDRRAGVDRRVQDAAELPLPARRRRQPRLRHAWPRAPRSAWRRSARSAGAQLPRARERVLARRDLAREAVLLELGEQLAEPRPGRMPSSRASSSPRTSGARGPAARRASAGAEQLAARARGAPRSPGSALRPRVARRSATVKTVTSAAYGLGRAQVAPDRAPVERALVDEEAEPQVVAAERRDVVGELAPRRAAGAARRGRAPPPRGRGRGSRAAAVGQLASASAAWRRRAAARRSASPRRA